MTVPQKYKTLKNLYSLNIKKTIKTYWRNWFKNFISKCWLLHTLSTSNARSSIKLSFPVSKFIFMFVHEKSSSKQATSDFVNNLFKTLPKVLKLSTFSCSSPLVTFDTNKDTIPFFSTRLIVVTRLPKWLGRCNNQFRIWHNFVKLSFDKDLKKTKM